MTIFVFTQYAKKKFLKLPKIAQHRILNRLRELKEHSDIFSVLRKLSYFEPATHRLRIGTYRLILQLILQNKTDIEFLILDVGHRKDIYKKK